MATSRTLIALVIAVTALTGCDGVARSAAPPNSTGPSPNGSTQLSGFGPGKELAHDLDVPWGLAFLPGGDALVAERDTGQLWRLSPSGAAPQKVYKMPGVAARREGGLLGLAVSPKYAEDQYVYAYLTTAADNRIVRFRLNGGAPEVVFAGIAKSESHDGGRIAFGPDGMLYAAAGDIDRPSLAQDLSSSNGKILRLTPDGHPAPGNPIANSPVYSLGHRNVQGLAWDSAGRLFASEFGESDYDEVNLIEPGRDYGWPKVEGKGDTSGGKFTNPLVTWRPQDASPSGVAITRDVLYVACLRGERLWAIPLKDGKLGTPRAELLGAYGRIRTVEVAPDGALWLTTSNQDGRGDRREGDDRVIRYPPR
jgi:glucose/arabinose dehydrogenase